MQERGLVKKRAQRSLSKVWSWREFVLVQIYVCSLFVLLLEGKAYNFLVVECSSISYIMPCIQVISNYNYRILFNLFNFAFLLTKFLDGTEHTSLSEYFPDCIDVFSKNFMQCCTLRYLEEIKIFKITVSRGSCHQLLDPSI